MSAIRIAGSGYTHTQDTPNTVWIVEHKLGRTPLLEAYALYQGVEQKILPRKVIHVSDDVARIEFSVALTGRVRAL